MARHIELTRPSIPDPPTWSEFCAIVREDYRANQASVLRPGFHAVLTVRVGWFAMSRRGRIVRGLLNRLYRYLHVRTRNRYGIEIHRTTRMGRGVMFRHQGAVVIHPYAIIGDECMIRQGVTLGSPGAFERSSAPTLGRGVQVGAGASILGPVMVGDGVRIGANAVVMSDVPANAMVVAPRSRVMEAADPGFGS